MNLSFVWALIFSTTLSVVLSFHVYVKTSRQHKARGSAQVFANSHVPMPPDTSVASRIDEAIPFLRQVGRSYPDDKGAWEQDIDKLHKLLHLTRYHHPTIKKHIFNLPINERTNDGHNHQDEQSLENYKHDYPFGPTYVRPIGVGQSIDLKHFIDVDSSTEWMPSLQVLTTLFLLASTVPLSVFSQVVVGGEKTLELLLRLGLVYLSSCDTTNKDEEWVVPVVHLFPLQIPHLPGTRDHCDVNHMVLMTDLHPTVLSVTSIPSTSDCPDEGAVMYIGPDSIALVQHLHASLLGYINNSNFGRPEFRILDVCCGSGVQALAALGMLDVLRKSGHTSLAAVDVEAVALDVNQRALRFTEFNARLNRLKVATMQSNLLADDAVTSIEEMGGRGESKKFDILLSNPPFIPTPNLVSDDAALSLRETASVPNNSQSYGLFSSGGVSGEDCLCAIIKMTPRVLRSDGGLMGIVSEFMNPPLSDSVEQKCVLLTKLEQWWGADYDVAASGVLFTNEYPLDSQVYSQRRALTDDKSVISLWLNHLERNKIYHVSPGLLFVKLQSKVGNPNNATGCSINYRLVPKTNNGSVWTPHNFNAVEYTMKILNDLYHS